MKARLYPLLARCIEEGVTGDVVFLNLTNGIEALSALPLRGVRFLRIQSTWCEQKRWSDIVEDLDYEFLLRAALGYRCLVVDYSAKRDEPRALWQGLAFLRWLLNREWHGVTGPCVTRGHNAAAYFEEQPLSAWARKKIAYFGPFVAGSAVRIEWASAKTRHDGKKDRYAALLHGAAFKHTDSPTQEAISEYVEAAVLSEVCEAFDLEDATEEAP